MFSEGVGVGEKEQMDRQTFEPIREYEIITLRYGMLRSYSNQYSIRIGAMGLLGLRALEDLDQCRHPAKQMAFLFQSSIVYLEHR